MSEKFKCPLCESFLSENRYYRIIGVWEEKKKFEDELKKQLAITKKARENFRKKEEEMKQKGIKERKDFEKKLKKQFEDQEQQIINKANAKAEKASKKEIVEIKKRSRQDIIKARKESETKGRTHEKKRADNLSSMVQRQSIRIEQGVQTIKELRDQLKKGTTPQIEGLNLEKELVKELKSKFPDDIIEHRGKGGDVLQYIMSNKKNIGLIVYECKKTKKFLKSYISKLKSDVVKRNASYGVLVTTASEKNKVGFWIRKDILIVHPYGAIYIAEFIRKGLITIHSQRLNKEELSEQAKKLLEYIKSDKFKNAVGSTIHSSRELNELLNKERATHEILWERRHQHYRNIHEKSSSIDEDSKAILKIEKEPEEKLLLPIPRRKRGRRG